MKGVQWLFVGMLTGVFLALQFDTLSGVWRGATHTPSKVDVRLRSDNGLEEISKLVRKTNAELASMKASFLPGPASGGSMAPSSPSSNGAGARFDETTLAPLWQHLQQTVFAHWEASGLGSQVHFECSSGLDADYLRQRFADHALPKSMQLSTSAGTANRSVHFSNVYSWFAELRSQWKALPPGAIWIQRITTQEQYEEGIQYLLYLVQCHVDNPFEWKWSCDRFPDFETKIPDPREIHAHIGTGLWSMALLPGFVMLEKDPTVEQAQAFNNGPFEQVAKTLTPVTDKVDWAHNYQSFYDRYMTPMRTVYDGTLLEIGLGCNMLYGQTTMQPGASHQFWQKFTPKMLITFLEFDKPCSEQYMVDWLEKTGKPVKVWAGSQDEKSLCNSIVAAHEPGRIQVMIDDASHQTKLMVKSLLYLWPGLASGGLYIIEDLWGFAEESVESPHHHQKETVLQVIYDWGKALVLPTAASAGTPGRDVDLIECKFHICVLRKRR